MSGEYTSTYRVNIVDYESKLSDLRIRLSNILEIEDTIDSCSINLQQKNIVICYKSQLLPEQYNILANLVSIIFNGSSCKEFYPSVRVITSSKKPSQYCDCQCGYNVGTMCINTTTNTIYICTNNSKDKAVWGLLLQKSPRTPRSISHKSDK